MYCEFNNYIIIVIITEIQKHVKWTQNQMYRSHDKVCNVYMKFCVNVTQNFVGNKLQVLHTNFCVTCTQHFLQCTHTHTHTCMVILSSYNL